MPFDLQPLPAGDLPPGVARLVGGPPQARLMAAKGIAPMRPGEMCICLYQLSFDTDASVRAAVEAAPSALPEALIIAGLGEALPAPVLHFFAERMPVSRAEPLAKILYNRAADDQTFVLLARRLDERETEIIAQNEERLLRCPAIVEALYFNRKARMSSVNRAIELCVRNGVRIDAIPAYDEIAKSIGADPVATDPVADASFQEALQAADLAAAEIGDAPFLLDEEDGEHAQPVPRQAKKEEPKKSAIIDFGKLKLHEKIRLATLGNGFARQTLMRDSNKVVALAAIKSPQTTDLEVIRASANRALSEDVIRYIANNRTLVKLYPVKVNLVKNPKCPIAMSLRLIPYLHADDLKGLARSKNIPSALSVAARKLAAHRGIG